MPMQSPQDLFLHELSDMYDAEQRILQMLPLLAKEAQEPQVQQAYQMHEQQTRQQIQNLDQCFSILGEQPQKTTCYAIQGLKQEHDHFLKEQPAPQILQMFDLGAADKTEHYEITAYTGLIDKAKLMGQSQVASLLQQNLQQEQAMAQKVEQFDKQLGKQMISPMGQQQTGQQSHMHP
jgi:ferritin-like metal-binding protein YciE